MNRCGGRKTAQQDGFRTKLLAKGSNRGAPNRKNLMVDAVAARPGAAARDHTKGATASLEISSVESSDRSPLEFAKKFKENPADKLFWKWGFPVWSASYPKFLAMRDSLKWANPVTADSFRDHGHRADIGIAEQAGHPRNA